MYVFFHFCVFFFFFNDTATTEIYTLSLHDALPISVTFVAALVIGLVHDLITPITQLTNYQRSEEHTSELQSRLHLVCRLLLEKKKTTRSAMMVTMSIHRLILMS